MRQRSADPGTGHSPRGRRCEHPSQGDHPQNWRATSQRPAGRSYAFNTADVHAPLVFYVMVSVGLYFFFCVVTRALAPAVFRVFPFPCSFLVAFPRGGEVVRPCRHSVQPLASFGQCSYLILFLVLSSWQLVILTIPTIPSTSGLSWACSVPSTCAGVLAVRAVWTSIADTPHSLNMKMMT